MNMSEPPRFSLVPAPRAPVMGVCSNPLLGMRESDMREVAPFATIESLTPPAEGLLIVRHNGEWLLPDEWPTVRALPGDTIEWYDMPSDKDSLRSVLQIAAIAFALVNPLGWSTTALLAFQVGSTLAINVLLPPTQPQAQQQGPAPAQLFTTSLQGNIAALDSPVWKTFGRRRITPPFAAPPYFKYVPKDDPDGTGDTSDQMYYALLAVGIGEYSIERELIGVSALAGFRDVTVHRYLPPGVQPSDVLANVTTSPEVSGMTMESGKYVGGFAACDPRRTVAHLGIDVSAVRGLGKNGGSLTVTWRVEARPINDFGVPLGNWYTVATESRTASVNTPQRWTNEYDIATPARLEVRLVRTDTKDTDSVALHELAWLSMRAFLAQPAPLNPNVAHYEIVLRASEQLNSTTQRQLALIVNGYVRTWSPSLGWAAESLSRNGAWHIVEIATSSVLGLGYADDRIDLQSFYDLSLTADTRQDRCDYTFTASMDAWAAMQLIARTMRARVFRRAGGMISIARDEWLDLPVTAFTPRNTTPDSMALHEALPTLETNDGVILEYEDFRSWKWTPIECPCPGVTTMQRPLRKRIDGIVGATHAQREGMFEAASMLYRRTMVSCTTEMQGMLPAYLSPVYWMPELRGYGQSGDVVEWDDATLVMGLSEPVVWGALPSYLTLIRDDGSVTVPVAVAQGPTEYDVRLPVAPDFTIVIDDPSRERPKYLIGPLVESTELVKVAAIGDGGKTEDGAQLYDISGIVDDERAHTADLSLLPAPGEIQDPIDASAVPEGGGGESLALVNLNDHRVEVGNAIGGGDVSRGYIASFTLHNDGSASSYEEYGLSGGVSPITTEFASEWLNAAVESSVAAGFEVRVSAWNQFGMTVTGDSLSTWLSLGTTRTWGVIRTPAPTSSASDFPGVTLTVEIREAGSGIVQATRHVILALSMAQVTT